MSVRHLRGGGCGRKSVRVWRIQAAASPLSARALSFDHRMADAASSSTFRPVIRVVALQLPWRPCVRAAPVRWSVFAPHSLLLLASLFCIFSCCLPPQWPRFGLFCWSRAQELISVPAVGGHPNTLRFVLSYVLAFLALRVCSTLFWGLFAIPATFRLRGGPRVPAKVVQVSLPRCSLVLFG